MTTADQVYDQAVCYLCRDERLRLAALILDDLTGAGAATPLDTTAGGPEEEEDEAAMRRAARLMPRLADLRRIIASGVKPETWHDGNEPLY